MPAMALVDSPAPPSSRLPGRLPLGARLARLAATAGFLALSVTAPIARAQDSSGINLIRDTEIEETLHVDADPIFVAAGLNPKDVTILLVGDKELNAFTVNGQLIAVNTGLIIATEDPGQLIGVIAHECGHIAGGLALGVDRNAHRPLQSMERLSRGMAGSFSSPGAGHGHGGAKVEIHVHQRPGEDGNALAHRVAAIIDRRDRGHLAGTIR